MDHIRVGNLLPNTRQRASSIDIGGTIKDD